MPATSQAHSQGDAQAAAGRPPRSGLEAQLAAARDILQSQRLRDPLDLAFSWDEIAFEARIAAASSARARLSLRADIGLLPYTIEDAGARQAALAGLRDLNREGRDRWSAGLDGRVRLTSETALAPPQSCTQAIAAITVVLLSLKPQLDLLAPLLHPSAGPRQRSALAQAV